jgi:hypothetical protein
LTTAFSTICNINKGEKVMSKKVTYNNNTPLNEAQKQDLQEILSTELPPGFFEKTQNLG